MKKFYLLLAAVMVTLSSFAAPMISKSAELKAGLDLKKANVEARNSIESGKVQPMRSWTDANGVVWSSYMIVNEGLWNMITDVDDDPTTENTVADFPAYWVTLVFSSPNAEGTDYAYYYQLDLCWPAYCLWYTDEDEARAALGEEHMWDPTPLEVFTAEDVFTMLESGYVNVMNILNPETLGAEGICVYNGSDGYTFNDNTTVAFDNYDEELSWLDIILSGTLSGSLTRNVSLNYSGEVTLLGFASVAHNVEVGEVHIFDCGDIDYDNKYAMVYVEEFEPVRRYHVAFTSTDFAFLNPETGEAWNNVYTSTQLPTGPGAYVNEGAEYFSFWGTFFAEEGSEKPYGIWTNDNPWKQDPLGDIINTPEAYVLMLGGYKVEISQQDGTWAVYGDFYRNPALGTANMVIGSTNGMRFAWTDMFGDTWIANYDGEIYFHNNPDNFVPYEMIPSIGTIVDSVEKIETEKINVKVVGNSIVAPEGAEIYNLNGVRVNANDLENGLYIVKVGKNAVKVVL